MEILSPGFGEWFIISIVIAVLILPVLALIDIIRSQFTYSENKLIWVLVVLLLPFIGSILYFLIGRSQKTH